MIHVVDTSNNFYNKQIEVTNDTLEEIGVHDIPTLYIYNKKDLLTDIIEPTYFPNLIVSLFNNEDVSHILNLLEKELYQDYETVKLLIPFNEGELVSYLIENTHIINQEYSNEGTILELELSQIQESKYASYLI